MASTQMANTGSAAASRRCTPGSRRASPAIRAARGRKICRRCSSPRSTSRTEGESRRITKREAVVAQLVDKSAGADWRATKMMLDILQDIEKRAGAAPPPEVSPLTAADAEVVENLLARLRRTEFATSPSKS